MTVAVADVDESEPSAGAAGRRAPIPWQEAEVVGLIDEAPDTVSLQLRLQVDAGFLPGQYYNVRMPIPGKPRPVQRAYSVASSPYPDSSVIEIGVREVPGGLVSPRLVKDYAIGDKLEVRGPYGRFVWNEEMGGPVLLVGAGSGLVPLMCIIRYNLARGLEVPMAMLCSAMDYEHALYRAELAEIQEATSWLKVVHTVTRDPAETRVTYHRRIDKEMLADVMADLSPRLAYLCGPPAMVEMAADSLADLGLAPDQIRTEKYD